MTRTVLVIGGTGRIGGILVARCAARGDNVRIMSRRPGPEQQDARFFVGSITDRDVVEQAMREVDAVVITVEPPRDAEGVEAVLHRGVRSVAEVAASSQAAVVLVSQIYITRPHAMPGFEEIVAARARGEQALRASGAQYSIVRPSWLTDEPGGRAGLLLDQGDTGEGSVTREDIAGICLQALVHPQARGKTFEVYNTDGPPDIDWAKQFDALDLDPQA
ncbi:NAD(P)H-binding protein [Nocardia sp. NBC_01327]|uniref:NAD(P)H-binding protein n=1 Tax=Nocardia sp. NBC_01327 TaxID=2903593 RepID=UPI002E14B2C1|nr:NAD(P)H-binding protein [Nocardia sp. NBC_01327]